MTENKGSLWLKLLKLLKLLMDDQAYDQVQALPSHDDVL